jgi:chromosome segregation ATPase
MSVEKDTDRFTIRDEEESAGSLYISDAENLRIDKLSTKITLISILIPLLLVIILAVAYLDIKNRVVSTQNTGSMGVQNLSKDLESRFSSLSLKQAKLEEQYYELTQKIETSSAAFQVNLKKATARFDQTVSEKVDRSELSALSEKQETAAAQAKKEIGKLQDQMKVLNAAFAKFDEELAAQILLMAEGFKKEQDRLSKVEGRTQKLETEKLSKEAMNLALGLERLSLQEMVKDRLREMNDKLNRLDGQVRTLNRKMDGALNHGSQAPSKTPLPTPIPSPESQPNTQQIEEQSIQ